MRKFEIKSYCKINLNLKVIKKLDNGYHNIMSLITFCGFYDLISVYKIKSLKDKITFSGKFKSGISSKKNTVTKLLSLLRKSKLISNQSFKINIKKNIPHGSGLGGGSSNAANLLNFFNSNMGLKLSKKTKEKLAMKVGFDVPINLEKKNTLLTGRKNEIVRLSQKFKLNILIVYPNLICSTKKIYKKNKVKNKLKSQFSLNNKNKKKFIMFLKEENNDLEKIVIQIYPKVKNIIDYIESQKGCYFSRITGSGSACIGIFSNMKNADYAKKLIRIKYPKYWCAVSKTI